VRRIAPPVPWPRWPSTLAEPYDVVPPSLEQSPARVRERGALPEIVHTRGGGSEARAAPGRQHVFRPRQVVPAAAFRSRPPTKSRPRAAHRSAASPRSATWSSICSAPDRGPGERRSDSRPRSPRRGCATPARDSFARGSDGNCAPLLRHRRREPSVNLGPDGVRRRRRAPWASRSGGQVP